jgi:hypothetical protein
VAIEGAHVLSGDDAAKIAITFEIEMEQINVKVPLEEQIELYLPLRVFTGQMEDCFKGHSYPPAMAGSFSLES